MMQPGDKNQVVGKKLDIQNIRYTTETDIKGTLIYTVSSNQP